MCAWLLAAGFNAWELWRRAHACRCTGGQSWAHAKCRTACMHQAWTAWAALRRGQAKIADFGLARLYPEATVGHWTAQESAVLLVLSRRHACACGPAVMPHRACAASSMHAPHIACLPAAHPSIHPRAMPMPLVIRACCRAPMPCMQALTGGLGTYQVRCGVVWCGATQNCRDLLTYLYSAQPPSGMHACMHHVQPWPGLSSGAACSMHRAGRAQGPFLAWP